MIYLVISCLVAAIAATPELKTENAPRKIPDSAAFPGEKKDPVDEEYEKLVELDEAALKDVEKMSAEFQAFQDKGAGNSRSLLAAKIDARLEPVKKAYEEFLLNHSGHVDARIAYGSFLNEIGEEEDAIVQWEKARSLAPNNPTPWNNLANVYAHIGPVKKAFQYYEKAIELMPSESVYLHNLATVVYLFRKDAAESYRIDEEAIFNKSLDLYRRAMKLDPTNIVLATDYAQSYYGIKPLRTEDAIAAWNHALSLAKSEAEKEGIYLHLARVELNSNRFADAEKHLAMVKNPEMQDLRQRLQKNLQKKRADPENSGKVEKEEKTEKPAPETATSK